MGIHGQDQRPQTIKHASEPTFSGPQTDTYAPWPNLSEPPLTLVAFDFDGTLTVKDSFMAFLAWHAGAPRYLLGMVQLIPASLIYLITRDRGALKSAAVSVFLKGLKKSQLEASANMFARTSAAKLLRPDALAAWQGWGSQGAVRVIVTASPEFLIAPFAKHLGAEGLIGTRLAYNEEGRVQGWFVGENCRAAEKVERLKAAYGPAMTLTAAYGDTSGDAQMLAIAKAKGYRVFRQKP